MQTLTSARSLGFVNLGRPIHTFSLSNQECGVDQTNRQHLEKKWPYFFRRGPAHRCAIGFRSLVLESPSMVCKSDEPRSRINSAVCYFEWHCGLRGAGGIYFVARMLHRWAVSPSRGPHRAAGKIPMRRFANFGWSLLHGQLGCKWACVRVADHYTRGGLADSRCLDSAPKLTHRRKRVPD